MPARVEQKSSQFHRISTFGHLRWQSKSALAEIYQIQLWWTLTDSKWQFQHCSSRPCRESENPQWRRVSWPISRTAYPLLFLLNLLLCWTTEPCFFKESMVEIHSFGRYLSSIRQSSPANKTTNDLQSREQDAKREYRSANMLALCSPLPCIHHITQTPSIAAYFTRMCGWTCLYDMTIWLSVSVCKLLWGSLFGNKRPDAICARFVIHIGRIVFLNHYFSLAPRACRYGGQPF